MRLASSAIVVVLALTGLAAAQDRDRQRQLCVGGPGVSADQSIEACTALIDAGAEPRPNRAGVLTSRGLAYLAKGKSNEAVKDFDQALRLDPRDLRAVRGRATALAKAVDFPRAIKDYDVLLRHTPTDETLLLDRASIFLRDAQLRLGIQDADQEFITGSQRGVVQVYRSVLDYDHAIGLNPVDPDRFSTRGVIGLRRRNLDVALRGFDAVIRLNPDLARAYALRGTTWLIRNEPDRAIEDFDRAIRLDPLDAISFANRATAWRDKGHPDRAIADLDEAIRLVPSDVRALTNRGNAWIDKGRFERAVADFDAALRVRPYTRAFESRGVAYTRMGRHEQALQDFTEAIRLRPWNPTALRHRCRTRAILGQVRPANLDCLESTRWREEHPGTLENSGFVNLQGGHLRAAIRRFTEALEIQPNRATALYSRGVARLRRGDTSDGAADIAAAVAINPDIAVGMINLGLK